MSEQINREKNETPEKKNIKGDGSESKNKRDRDQENLRMSFSPVFYIYLKCFYLN